MAWVSASIAAGYVGWGESRIKGEMMNRGMIGAMLALSSLAWASPAWSAEAGRVQFVQGTVQASDAAGRERALQKGDAVNEGDTLLTAAGASAQLRMADGGYIAVRPDTRMKIDSFRFGKAEERESSILSLFKGGFRAITGLIGRVRKEDYRITTPAATIGIRGTDHETMVVLPDNPLVSGGKAAAGTYNKVNAGETIITTDKGTLNVLPNQMGYAGGMSQMPKQLPVNANLFAAAPPPPASAKVQEGGQEGEAPRETAVVDNTSQQQAASTDTVAGATGTSTTGTSSVLAATAPPTIVPTISQTLPTLPNLAAGGIGLYFSDAAGIWTDGGGGTLELLPTSSGGLGAFKVLGGFSCGPGCLYTVPFQSGNIGTATLQEQGTSAAAGNIHWGRWVGQGASVTGLPAGSTFLGNLVYIVGDIPTMPRSGTAIYAPVGGTSPVDSKGNTGTFLGANVSVNFATPAISVTNMQVAFGGNTYTMAGAGSFSANGTIPAVPMSGTCTGPCATGTAMNGDYAGSFTGANASGLALVYHIATTTPVVAVAVAAVPGRTPPTFEIMGSQAFVRK